MYQHSFFYSWSFLLQAWYFFIGFFVLSGLFSQAVFFSWTFPDFLKFMDISSIWKINLLFSRMHENRVKYLLFTDYFNDWYILSILTWFCYLLHINYCQKITESEFINKFGLSCWNMQHFTISCIVSTIYVLIQMLTGNWF